MSQLGQIKLDILGLLVLPIGLYVKNDLFLKNIKVNQRL